MRPYMRAANVGWNGLRLEDVKEMDFSPDEYATYALQHGDVLVGEASGSRDEVGKSAVWRGEIPGACFQNTLIRVRVNRAFATPDFVQLRLQHDASRGALAEISKGVGIHHLGRDGLASWEIPLPPLDEQRRIVAKLDALRARSRRAKDALDAVPALLERLRQSILAAAFRGDLTADWRAQNPEVEPASELLKRIRIERRKRWEEAELAKMVAKGKPPKDDRWKTKYVEPEPVDESELPELPEGWCWASVSELALVESGQTPPDIESRHAQDGTLRWFRVGDMNHPANQHLLREGGIRLSPAGAAALGLHVRPRGTIVFPKRGGAIATNKKRRLAEASAYDLNVMGLVPAESIGEHLWLWFQSVDLAQLNTGSAVPQINHGDIAPIPVPVPSAAESQVLSPRVSASLAAIAATETERAVSASRLADLDSAILAAAFRGELVAREHFSPGRSLRIDTEGATVTLQRRAVL